MNITKSSIKKLFQIDLPIVQGGMVFCSGGKLAGTVSACGGLGLIGAGSMTLEVLEKQIVKAKGITDRPIGVNLPLLYSKVEQQIELCLEQGIRIFFTSAGSPKKWTGYLKDRGAIVTHVTSTPELALKCEKAGVDAIVAEGFEAGGHNGRDEITTMTLIPQVVRAVKIPVIAAGGIGTGAGISAALALGADAVQIGSRFAATWESSAHNDYKNAVCAMGATDTALCMKKLVPVRMYKNKFFDAVQDAEQRCATPDDLREILGKGRARAGILDGDIAEGEIEIGQISGLIDDVPSVSELMERLAAEYRASVARLAADLSAY